MSEDIIKEHIMLRSRMFKCSNNQAHYNVTRRLEELTVQIYTCLLSSGDTVVDIGAHTGYHTRYISDLIGSSGVVLAIEPNLELKERFNTHLGIRNNVILLNEVLSDSQKDSFFYYVSGAKSSRSSLSLWDKEIPDSEYSKTAVHTTTLDLIFDLNNLKFIKIDAEGSDLACLVGGLNTIKKYRPHIVLEWNKTSFQVQGYHNTDLWNFVKSIDYHIFNTFNDDLTNLDLYEKYADKFSDFFLTPSEKLNEFKEDTSEAILLTLARYEDEIMEKVSDSNKPN